MSFNYVCFSFDVKDFLNAFKGLLVFFVQGRIQTENGSVQTLWAPKKMSPKMKKRKRKLFLSDKLLK